MSGQSSVPVLREVIRRGELPEPAEPELDSTLPADSDQFHHPELSDQNNHGETNPDQPAENPVLTEPADLAQTSFEPSDSALTRLDETAIERQYRLSLEQIQNDQQQINITPGTAGEESALPELEPDVRELLVDEEIRQILDRHMDNAYREIIALLSHKLK